MDIGRKDAELRFQRKNTLTLFEEQFEREPQLTRTIHEFRPHVFFIDNDGAKRCSKSAIGEG